MDKVFVVERTVSLAGGASAEAVLGAFTTPEDAREFEARAGALMAAIGQSTIELPTGERMPMMHALAQLGILGFKQSINAMQVRTSNLLVSEPRIVLAR